MCLVKTFFGVKLPTAAKTIAWIDLLLSIISISVAVYALIIWHGIEDLKYEDGYERSSQLEKQQRAQIRSYGKHTP